MADLNGTSSGDDAGGDSSQNTNDGTPDSLGTQTNNQDTSTTNTGANTSGNAGSTVAGKSGNNAATQGGKVPKPNPLGSLSSYTYQVTLYMVTPEAYNAFITSGRKNINSFSTVAAGNANASAAVSSSSEGVYLIAQSGGINNASEKRAPGFDLDYYIENLEIHSTVAQGAAQSGGAGPTNGFTIKFQIIEPYGFSFISKLRTATRQVTQYSSSLPNVDKVPYPDRQNYILGINFLGYDESGNLVTGSNSRYQQFYDFKMGNVTFKLDGRAVVYNVSGLSAPVSVGMGLKNGRILSDTTVQGSDVDSMIQSLFKSINKQQEDLQKATGIQIPNQYEVVYIGKDGDAIKTSSIVNSAADNDKKKLPVNEQPKTTDTINTKDALNARPDSTQRILSFKGSSSTSILDAITNIIKQSAWIEQSIKNLYKNETEPDRKTDDYDTASVNSNKKLKWINVSTEIINLGYDVLVKDWAYKIRYIVSSYETPIVNITQVGATSKYPGPDKRYEYWLTGKNSEVTKFDLSYNSLYATVALSNLKDQQDIMSPIPVMVGAPVNEQRQGRTGAALQSQNSYVNFLNDKTAYATAHLTILGDPDWLIQDQTSSVEAVYDPNYGPNGYSINPNSGQKFIEVDFKEAIDYDNSQGVMSVNNKLLFFDFPSDFQSGPNKLQGIPFRVSDVVSKFVHGKFEQTLTLLVDFWPDSTSVTASTTSAAGAGREGLDASGRRTAATDPRVQQQVGQNTQGTSSNNDTNTTGFAKVAPIPVQTTVSASSPTAEPPTTDLSNLDIQIASTNAAPENQSLTGPQNNPVADDDAAAMAAAFTNSPVNTTSVNITDAGRETPANLAWTTTWV